MSRVAFLLTLVACIHGLTLPEGGDDLTIKPEDRREHRRHHPAEAPPPTIATTATTTSTTTAAQNPQYADCKFSLDSFILHEVKW